MLITKFYTKIAIYFDVWNKKRIFAINKKLILFMSILSLRSLLCRNKKQDDGIHYIEIDETDSTNHYIKSILANLDGVQKEPRITVAYSDYQTAGRGQGTNTWESERGKNLLFSILCHPVWVPITAQFVISEAEAIAIRDTLTVYTEDISIKWPNDIYWKDKKISGTLIENTISAGHIKDCIIGTGININQTTFSNNLPNPVSLCQIVGHELDRMAILKDIINRFNSYLTDIRNGNYEKIISLYQSYLYRSHGFFKFRDKAGDFEAAIIEVEDDGHLILRDKGDHIRSYAFKEVEFII